MNAIALLLVIIGAINWLLVGALDFNLVTYLLGVGTMATKIIYIVVGLAGLYCIKMLIKK